MALGAVAYVVAVYYFVCFAVNSIGAARHPNAAESEPHGLDGLAVVICFAFFIAASIVGTALFTPGILLFISSKKSKNPTRLN